MLNYLKTLAKSLVSSQAADEIYRHSRQGGDPERGVRNKLTFNVALVLALVIFSFLSIITFDRKDPRDYVQERPSMVVVDQKNVQIELATPEVAACNTVEACIDYFSDKPMNISYDSETFDGETLTKYFGNDSQVAQTIMQISIPFGSIRKDITEEDLLIHFPRFRFAEAHVFIDGIKERSYLNSDHIVLPIKSFQAENRTFKARILVDLDHRDAKKFITWSEPVFLTNTIESVRYERFLEARRANPNRQISTNARIVLALFALILFMLIESSPESLGLALFMGFEALGIAIGHSDLREQWLPPDINFKGIEHFCHAMGDIFRMYFYVQLARIARPSVGKWLFWGCIYSVPYAYLRHINLDLKLGDTQWHTWMVCGRDVVIAMVGVLICSRQAMYLRDKGLPWRVTALSLASIAATAQFFSAAPFFVPELRIIGDLFGGYGSFVFFVNANGAYLFALSTFINISTLENRVKVLSREKARAQEIERELELGRSVQQAFLELPKMPAQIGLACHYEAAVYVSGDTYFVHWNKNVNVLTFLINDVTGHGIQAALKAFACNIIARSVWNKPTFKNDRRSNEIRLEKYDQAVEELICRDGDIPDFNAMVGVEFHQEEGLVKFYRVNYNFPIMIEPTFDLRQGAINVPPTDRWKVSQVSVPNRKVQEYKLEPGTFILLVSDGFMETARESFNFVGFLRRKMMDETEELSTRRLRQIALEWENSADKAIDDRTLLAFQWNPYAQENEDSNSDVTTAA